MTTTDTTPEAPPPIPQAFAEAAEQAELTLTRTRYGLELTDERGHGITLTPDFEHWIPMLCANGGAMFKKRFVRDAVDDEQDAVGDDDDDEGEVQGPRVQNITAEEFQDFREQVQRLTIEAQDMCEAVEYGTIKEVPDPLGALTDLVSASKVLSELATEILEDMNMRARREEAPDEEEEEPASS